MVKPSLEPGSIIDGYRIEECVHRGGMATLWSASHPDLAMPMLMKVPEIGEGEDSAAIVSFEMEQMIMPRLSGVHVPKFVAAGDFAVRPYIVMERIGGQTLVSQVGDLPLPYSDVVDIGVKAAAALDDLHRQHVIHLDVKPANLNDSMQTTGDRNWLTPISALRIFSFALLMSCASRLIAPVV